MIYKTEDLVGTLFHDVAHLIRLRIDDELRPYELTRASWLAIGVVAKSNHLSQSELAEVLELGTAATGKVIDRLEERGLIERHADPDDRRTNRLTITEEARKLIKKLHPVSKRLRKEILQDLSEAEQRQLKTHLATIKARLSQANGREQNRGS